MKLSKLYSNQPSRFEAIAFSPELNVVMAEIRLPENQDRDTHNLGKTTLGRLLDFGFLAGRDPKFFLFRHEQQFTDFVFYLEIELADGGYVTVRRGVAGQSRIAFKKHIARHQDFSSLPDRAWDHVDVPFERAKDLLDSYLDWRALKLGTIARVSVIFFGLKRILATFSICVVSPAPMPTGSHSLPIFSVLTRS
nr:hypothetical protein [Acetobacter persici]